MRSSRSQSPLLDPTAVVVPIGKCKIEREGSDITIVGHSKSVGHAIEAADALAKEGIKVEVINLRSIRPLDIETIIKSVKKTGRLVTVEGGFPAFGVGSEIIAQLVESEAWDYLDSAPERITGADVPTPYAANLESESPPQTFYRLLDLFTFRLFADNVPFLLLLFVFFSQPSRSPTPPSSRRFSDETSTVLSKKPWSSSVSSFLSLPSSPRHCRI